MIATQVRDRLAPIELSGVDGKPVVLDRGRTVRFLHRGRTLGDYPTIAELLAAARSLPD